MRIIRDYYDGDKTTAMKEGFDDRLIASFNENAGRWAVRPRDVGYRLRRSTMRYPQPYEADPVPVSPL